MSSPEDPPVPPINPTVPNRKVPAGGGSVAIDPGADPLVGSTLMDDRYQVEEKLGEGGMGAVYRARHRVLDKQVALKVLHPELCRKPELVERFLNEARAASRIRHENVIDITDFGSGDGVVFFAMELLDGRDLQRVTAEAALDGQRLPWSRSRPIFLQVCAALSAAHKVGILHRDLKPENIYLIEWMGHQDFVKLLDFGIAKATDVPEEGRKLTRTGMLFGTPEYMSPEQARGDKPDQRVDVYAMGCILYQLITNKVPFAAESFMGILSKHLSEPPPLMGGPALAEVGAPPGLEEVVQTALSKDWDQRYPSIDALADAVRAADDAMRPRRASQVPPMATDRLAERQWSAVGGPLAHSPVEVAGRPPVRRSSSRRLLWIGGGAVLAAVAGGLVAMITGAGHGGGARTGDAGAQVAPAAAATSPAGAAAGAGASSEAVAGPASAGQAPEVESPAGAAPGKAPAGRRTDTAAEISRVKAEAARARAEAKKKPGARPPARDKQTAAAAAEDRTSADQSAAASAATTDKAATETSGTDKPAGADKATAGDKRKGPGDDTPQIGDVDTKDPFQKKK